MHTCVGEGGACGPSGQRLPLTLIFATIGTKLPKTALKTFTLQH